MKEFEVLNEIHNITKGIFINIDNQGNYKAIKNTTKKECYKALDEIIKILRKAGLRKY